MSKNNINSEEFKEKYNKILDNYGKKQGLNAPEQAHYVTNKTNTSKIRESKKVGDIWKENEYWVEKLGNDTYSRSRHHPDVWKERGKIVDSYNRPECECGKKIKNENEKTVFRARGKCFECLTEQEIEAIADKKPYEPRKITKNDMIIKDSMGRNIMSIAELEEELGMELTADDINHFSKFVQNKLMKDNIEENEKKSESVDVE